MPIINRIADYHDEMTAWRRDIHAHPEIAFEEKRTSDFVAGKLADFGIEVHRGLAGTGVVGTLRGNDGAGPSVALRADMDALCIEEKNDVDYRSGVAGKMHACGHDGHTTMLLGAAKYLAETRKFAGTVYFVFQPAEEHEGGGRVMVEEGLFDKFPADAVFGMHNFPGLETGKFSVRTGVAMAAADSFDINILGTGSHAAAPHFGTDAIVAGAHIVTALQTVASRAIDPLHPVVVTVTQFHGGDTYNVIPEKVVLRGTVRTLDAGVQQQAEAAIRRIVEGVAASAGVTAEVDYMTGYPPTVNDEAESEFAAAIAAGIVGADNVVRNANPKMGAEDFSFMLNERPGCYVWIGNGPGESGCWLHNPHYDFNDEILPLGASYWARLVETRLSAR